MGFPGTETMDPQTDTASIKLSKLLKGLLYGYWVNRSFLLISFFIWATFSMSLIMTQNSTNLLEFLHQILIVLPILLLFRL